MIRGDSHPATPRPRPENVHLPRETATYPPAGTRWIEAIVLSPGRAVKEGVWGGAGWNTVTITRQGVGGGQFDRVTQITEPAGRSLTLAYDASGHLATVTDPIGRVVRYDASAISRICRA